MLVLVTGGSGSGKSKFAERLAVSLGSELTYIAAMQPIGAETEARIERHRKQRDGMGFHTIECYTDIKKLTIRGTALLECMSNLLANEMFSESGAAHAGKNVTEEIVGGIDNLLSMCDNLVIVTNEIFSDGNDYDSETIHYMKNLGLINRIIAARADAVYEIVCGRADRIK